MEKQEMIDFLKARGLFERGMQQLVGWQLMEMVEEAQDMGVATLDETEELKILEDWKEEPKEEKKPKAKPKAKKTTKAKKK